MLAHRKITIPIAWVAERELAVQIARATLAIRAPADSNLGQEQAGSAGILRLPA